MEIEDEKLRFLTKQIENQAFLQSLTFDCFQ